MPHKGVGCPLQDEATPNNPKGERGILTTSNGNSTIKSSCAHVGIPGHGAVSSDKVRDTVWVGSIVRAWFKDTVKVVVAAEDIASSRANRTADTTYLTVSPRLKVLDKTPHP